MTNIGLCTVVTLYAIAGAFIFEHLEQTNEKEECTQAQQLYNPMENSTVGKMWDISTSFRSTDDKDVAVAAFQKQLQSFRDDVLALSYDGSNCSAMGETGGPPYRWNFPGALLFSITVFTTIGK